MEDGWTQPIVVDLNKTIVDGFHRWTVSGDPEVYGLTDGKVPVVFIEPKDEASRRMTTIRMNRARGTHGVLPMADIIESMLKESKSMDEICDRLQMETEEVVRLANRKGIPKTEIITNSEWSKAWEPE